MQAWLPVGPGKRVGRRELNILGSGMFFLQDDDSKQQFMMDTGAVCSVLPHRSKAQPAGPQLSGADGRSIPTWGTIRRRLSFGLRTFFVTFFLLATFQDAHRRRDAALQVRRCPLLHNAVSTVPADRPQAARHIPVPHHAAMVCPPAATALLHRRIHIRHQTHTRPGERDSGRLEPPAFSNRAAAAAEPTALSHSHRGGLAGRGADGSGPAHPGCHRRCAAGRLFGDGLRSEPARRWRR